MARPRKTAKTAEQDFLRELRCRQGFYDAMNQRAMAELIGIPQSSLCKYLQDPDRIPVGILRKIITAMQPDSNVVAAWLGMGVSR